MNLFGWMAGLRISDAEVRAEIWRLGARHFGEPLQGAIGELRKPRLDPKRALLLRACVRKLQYP